MMKGLFVKYKKAVKYIFFSVITALIEAIVGLLCINCLGFNEVVSNAAGIIIGAGIHYLCVTRAVFEKNTEIRTLAVYIFTFFLGMALQNFIVWGVSLILRDILEINIRYLAAKVCSLAVSFVVMYQVRKYLYMKI